MPGEVRDEIAESIAQLSASAPSPSPAPAPEPAPAPAPEPAPSPSDTSGQQRDQSGRFAPRTPASNEVPANQEQGQKAVAPAPAPGAAPGAQQGQQTTQNAPGTQIAQPPAPTLRAPVSWAPEEREGWEQMSPKHQQAIMRREREIETALRTTAEARRFASEIQQVIAPYMPMIEAEQSTPVRAIQEVMRTAAVLRTAPPVQRAAAVADLIMQFGVDLNTLDGVLTAKIQGRPSPQDPLAPIQQMLQQQLAPVQKFMSQFEQQRQMQAQQEQQTVQTDVEAFMNDPQNEFARDVAAEMADLLELAAQRNQQLSLQEAYRRATLAHPQISQIVLARQAGNGVAQQTAAAQNARNAAASVSNSGAPSAGGDDFEAGDDVRSALAASMRQLSSRR